jgi:hypothetical protein
VGTHQAGCDGRLLLVCDPQGSVRTTYLTEVVGVHDGQVLDLPGAPRIIGLPGHSPGSIAIHVLVADAIFVGDALTTRHVLTGQRGLNQHPSPTIHSRQWRRSVTSKVSRRHGCFPATARRGPVESRSRFVQSGPPPAPKTANGKGHRARFRPATKVCGIQRQVTLLVDQYRKLV